MRFRPLFLLATLLLLFMALPGGVLAYRGYRGGRGFGRGGRGWGGGWHGSVRRANRSYANTPMEWRNPGSTSRAPKPVEIGAPASQAAKTAHHDYHHLQGIHAARIGAPFAALPSGHTTIVHAGTTYYRYGGSYAVRSESGYVVVRGPVGCHVRAVPIGHLVVEVQDRRYYYYAGVYYTYVPAQKDYEIVAAPVDAQVPILPEDAEKVEIDGKTYYKYGDTHYKPVFVGGDLWYRVIKL